MEPNLSQNAADLDYAIFAALERIYQAFRSMLWDYAKQRNLSPIQIQFLLYLASKPSEQRRVTNLAYDYNLTPATVSDAVKTLERKGLVERQTSPQDKRVHILNLTEKGRECTVILSRWQDVLLDQIAKFPTKTKESVILFLLRLVESLKEANIISEVKTCLSCQYFQQQEGKNNELEFRCLLRDVCLTFNDLKFDCPNYRAKE